MVAWHKSRSLPSWGMGSEAATARKVEKESFAQQGFQATVLDLFKPVSLIAERNLCFGLHPVSVSLSGVSVLAPGNSCRAERGGELE